MNTKNNKNRHSTRTAGNIGEAVASEYLKSKGYIILRKNYASVHGEIDIIAQKDDIIAFVEVKMRDSENIHGFGRPALAVTRQKMKSIIFTAKIYMLNTRSKLIPRFDVIEIYESADSYKLKHLESAFTLSSIE